MGSINNSLVFTFTAPTDGTFGSGSAVQFTIPANWTAPTGSNVTVADDAGGNCQPLAPFLSGASPGPYTVTVGMSCTAGSSFTITYNTGSTPIPAPVQTDTFTTTTRQGSGGTFTAIAISPQVSVVGEAANGNGTMAITPTLANAFTSNNQFVLTFTEPLANGSFIPGSSVTVLVPAGWTAPSFANTSVSAASGTCSLGTLVFSGQLITIPMACTASSSFTLTYGTGNQVTVTGPGPYQFVTKTQNGGSTLVTIGGGGPTVTVKPTTTTATSLNMTASVSGQSVIATATVAPVLSSAFTPSGTVEFFANGTPITGCTAQLLNLGSPDTASCTFLETTPGSYTITSAYAGDTNFSSSSDGTGVSLTVSQGSTGTSTNLTSSTVVTGQTIVDTATVAPTPPATGTPTGVVIFTIAGVPDQLVWRILGCGAKPAVADTAVCSFTDTEGSYTILATYQGDSNFFGSSGSSIATVNQGGAGTSTNLTSSTVVTGQTIVDTATVAPTPPATGTPTGVVIFTIAGVPINSCGGSLGVALSQLSPDTAVCNFTEPSGTFTILATYQGDTNFASSSGSSIVTVDARTIDTTPASDTVTTTASAAYMSTLASPDSLGTVTFTATSANGVSIDSSGNVTDRLLAQRRGPRGHRRLERHQR